MKSTISIILFIGIFNVNAQNVFLENAFWSKTTSIEDVKTAVQNGNNPSKFNSLNFDATTYAILNKAPFETIQFLLSYEGNEVSKITHDGRNYLMWAGYRGSFELVEYLIKKGSDIHLIDDKGNNLQTFTAMGGVLDSKIYDLYVTSDLKLDAPNRSGGTIIHYLTQHVKDIQQFDYFLKKGLSINAKDNEGSTVFHYASSQGNIDLLKQLIAAGLDPKAMNDKDENALFFASFGKRGFYNEQAVYEYLISLGLDPKQINTSGDNLLHYLAAGTKDAKVFSYLIEQGVDVQKINSNGNNPLMNAVDRNNSVAITVLYELTDDKSVVNAKGHNLLTSALRNQNAELVERLLKEGFDYKLLDKSENNLITHLVVTFNEKRASFFEKYYAELIKKGVAVQDRTLHSATAVENEFLVTTILNSGIDINVKNDEGITVLQLAAMKGHNAEFLQFLIAKGADKSIRTEFDESVYELAKSNELLEGDLEFLK